MQEWGLGGEGRLAWEPLAATTPSGAKPCPPSPSEHQGCSIGQGGRGRREPLVGAEPKVGLGGRRTEVGKAPSWDPRALIAKEPGLGVG